MRHKENCLSSFIVILMALFFTLVDVYMHVADKERLS